MRSCVLVVSLLACATSVSYAADARYEVVDVCTTTSPSTGEIAAAATIILTGPLPSPGATLLLNDTSMLLVCTSGLTLDSVGSLEGDTATKMTFAGFQGSPPIVSDSCSPVSCFVSSSDTINVKSICPLGSTNDETFIKAHGFADGCKNGQFQQFLNAFVPFVVESEPVMTSLISKTVDFSPAQIIAVLVLIMSLITYKTKRGQPFKLILFDLASFFDYVIDFMIVFNESAETPLLLALITIVLLTSLLTMPLIETGWTRETLWASVCNLLPNLSLAVLKHDLTIDRHGLVLHELLWESIPQAILQLINISVGSRRLSSFMMLVFHTLYSLSYGVRNNFDYLSIVRERTVATIEARSAKHSPDVQLQEAARRPSAPAKQEAQAIGALPSPAARSATSEDGEGDVRRPSLFMSSSALSQNTDDLVAEIEQDEEEPANNV